MKKITLAAVSAALLLSLVSLAIAQDRDDRSGYGVTPGHQIPDRDDRSGYGVTSGHLPDHPGASGYAPAHRNDDFGPLHDRDYFGVQRDRDR